VGQGKLSPSEFKNRCRFFIDSDFINLLKFIKHALSQTGTAFVLLRSLSDHNDSHDIEKISEDLNLSYQIVGQIRGADVIALRLVLALYAIRRRIILKRLKKSLHLRL